MAAAQPAPRRSSFWFRAPVWGRRRSRGGTAKRAGGWVKIIPQSRSKPSGNKSAMRPCLDREVPRCRQSPARGKSAGRGIDPRQKGKPISERTGQVSIKTTSPLTLAKCEKRCPLALSQFSPRAAKRPCENWSAAPASPRCICRRQRSAQLPRGNLRGCFCARANQTIPGTGSASARRSRRAQEDVKE